MTEAVKYAAVVYLDSCLAELQRGREALAEVDIRVLRRGERTLELVQLSRRERGPGSSSFPRPQRLVLLLRGPCATDDRVSWRRVRDTPRSTLRPVNSCCRSRHVHVACTAHNAAAFDIFAFNIAASPDCEFKNA